MHGHVNADDQALIENNVTVVNDCYEASRDAHAIAVLTEWDEFKEVDFQKIYASMHRPSFLFDGRNLLDHPKLLECGFEIHAIGKSPEQRSNN
jgi:UDPglucose 6-dehydrogenase